MTTAAEIVQRAYRQDNIIPIGRDPTDDEQAEALVRLNAFIATLFGHELGEKFSDWTVPPPQRNAPVAQRYPQAPAANDLPSDVWPYPPANSRLTCSITTLTTIYFPEKPEDGALMALVDIGMSATLTINGNGRLIEGATTRAVLSTDADDGQLKWMYRADLGEWIAITVLEAADDVPFPLEFEDLLVCGTAIRIAPANKGAPKETTAACYNDGLVKLKARYRQTVNQVGGGADIPRSAQTTGGASGPFGWM